MKIVAVVITLDRPEIASRCIASLLGGSIRPERIVVVDNGSAVPYLPPQEYEQDVEIVRLNHNAGPAGGAAAGQHKALTMEADWIWMVDDDAIADRTALARLVEQSSTHGARSFFRSVCYTAERPELPFFNSFAYNRKTGILRPVARERYREVEFAFDACSMAGLFVSRTLLQDVGVFDASLFGWYDDTEFTLRATLGGFQGYAVPGSRLLHPSANRRQVRILGRSIAVLVEQPRRLYYGTRNSIVTQRRLLPRLRFWCAFLPIFALRRFISIVLLYNNRRAFLQCFARGVLDGLRGRKGELV